MTHEIVNYFVWIVVMCFDIDFVGTLVMSYRNPHNRSEEFYAFDGRAWICFKPDTLSYRLKTLK